MDFFDLKGIVAGLLVRVDVEGWRLEPSERECFQPGRGAEIVAKGAGLGYLGELHAAVKTEFDLGQERVTVAEVDLDVLARLRRVPHLSAPSRFPAVVQDLALVVDEDRTAEDLERGIADAGGELLTGITVFDVYRGTQIPEGKKSVAFSLQFQAQDRTLTEDEASRQREKIVKALGQRFGAVLR